MWALVPIKRLSDAKQRLSPCLSPQERRELCCAMLRDVLTTLSTSPDIAGITVAGHDREIGAVAAAYGGEFLPESELDVRGVNPVVTAAITRLARRGFDDIFIALSDVPLFSKADLTAILATHAGSGDHTVTIATDRHHAGSNCLAASPAHRMDYHFGADSLRKHLVSARRAGMTTRVLSRPGTALDIDTPDDFALLRERVARMSNAQTAKCLTSLERKQATANCDFHGCVRSSRTGPT